MRRVPLRRLLPRLAAWGVLLFLVIVVFEHVANLSLDPARHEISEYVHTHRGWLMTTGFVVWALSLMATGIIAHSEGADALCVSLAVAALGIAVTACFATQTSAGRLPPGVSLSTSGRLHDLGSGLATVALLLAALLSLRLPSRPVLRKVTGWLLALACAGDLVLLAVGSGVAGIRQRLLVLVACIWQLALLTLSRADDRV